MGAELIYFFGVLAGLAVLLFIVRRASNKQLEGGAKGVQRRLREKDEDEAETETEAETEQEAEAEAEAEVEEEDDEEPEDEEEERLREGMAKTRKSGFVAKLGRLFSRKKIDEDMLDELEQVLFTADIGPKTANKIFDAVKSSMSKDELNDPEKIWSKIREESATILSVNAAPIDFGSKKPFVLLTIGVNGVGKTTTIGKFAAKLTREKRKVLLAAGDTFRAAATEQLEIWGDRAHAKVVKGKEGGDPSSVIYDAIKAGIDEDMDVVIADTAGRLHTKVELMEELKKVGRVCNKALEGAPHETWLVLDATTGQNAIQQAQLFKDAMDITGIVLTKLDGTAKGGVILGICDEIKVPVRYIGIGEQVDDLRAFDAEAFVAALYVDEDGFTQIQSEAS